MRHLPFKSTRAGIKVNLDGQERAILVQLLGKLDELLDDGLEASQDPLAAMVGVSGLDFSGLDFKGLDFKGLDGAFDDASAEDARPAAPSVPEDPALARLLPDGNRDDPEASAEYRRLTEFGLRARKRSSARLAADALGRTEPVVLALPEALALMKALTDVRLVLGERLELRTDEDAEKLHNQLWAGEGTEFWLVTASTYELLTAWQESLIAAVERKR